MCPVPAHQRARGGLEGRRPACSAPLSSSWSSVLDRSPFVQLALSLALLLLLRVLLSPFAEAMICPPPLRGPLHRLASRPGLLSVQWTPARQLSSRSGNAANDGASKPPGNSTGSLRLPASFDRVPQGQRPGTRRREPEPEPERLRTRRGDKSPMPGDALGQKQRYQPVGTERVLIQSFSDNLQGLPSLPTAVSYERQRDNRSRSGDRHRYAQPASRRDGRLQEDFSSHGHLSGPHYTQQISNHTPLSRMHPRLSQVITKSISPLLLSAAGLVPADQLRRMVLEPTHNLYQNSQLLLQDNPVAGLSMAQDPSRLSSNWRANRLHQRLAELFPKYYIGIHDPVRLTSEPVSRIESIKQGHSKSNSKVIHKCERFTILAAPWDPLRRHDPGFKNLPFGYRVIVQASKRSVDNRAAVRDYSRRAVKYAFHEAVMKYAQQTMDLLNETEAQKPGSVDPILFCTDRPYSPQFHACDYIINIKLPPAGVHGYSVISMPPAHLASQSSPVLSPWTLDDVRAISDEAVRQSVAWMRQQFYKRVPTEPVKRRG
ncbi:hypothetical protein H696_04588 [Fonticula alba]|uniref:Uncharacterized protein n=1 Tax=Fonticula alba TaxID=691883 RepID=A0A058Z4H7_FONAL|nr:hypothetical protein H696_04588 [Fonticula alba]KCV69175.1 hypothetical protein H696_04588 [Fonticula alba]|eukprot:XP_009496746.1 hypothetical protein H696_04588 [Fonticula alba]